MTKSITLLVLIVLLSVAGCTSKPGTNAVTSATYNIAGDWEYTLTASDGNVYDGGTISFIGIPDQGNWTQTNVYNVEYTGTYTVNGDAVSLEGDETWQGHFDDATHMSGSWQNDEASGVWTAVKK